MARMVARKEADGFDLDEIPAWRRRNPGAVVTGSTMRGIQVILCLASCRLGQQDRHGASLRYALGSSQRLLRQDAATRPGAGETPVHQVIPAGLSPFTVPYLPSAPAFRQAPK